MDMSNNENLVLCVSNSYQKKFYLNEHFQKLPDSIKDELKIMCVLYTEDIGGGLYIQHGFSTIITAKKIGENCRIYQQVTIGYKNGEYL